MLNNVNETQIAALSPRGSFLSTQELTFVKHYIRGMSPSQAARDAGYAPNYGVELLKKPEIAETCAVMREQVTKHLGVEITREFVSGLFLEAHRKAATATEEIAAARELGKLHGLYEPEKTVQVTKNIHTIQQLESLSDSDLLAMAQLPAERMVRPLPRVAAAQEPSNEPDQNVHPNETAAGEGNPVESAGGPPSSDPTAGPAAE